MRRLTLKHCQLDQAGEVSYQALNAITSAMLNVKGKKSSWYLDLTVYHGFWILVVKIKVSGPLGEK